MFQTLQPLILASGSPRRKAFFTNLGLVFDVCPADVDESCKPGEGPDEYVRRVAIDKANNVCERYPDSWVVSADTVVARGDMVIGKQNSAKEAVRLLMALSGKKHEVRTAYCIGHYRKGIRDVGMALTEVWFYRFNEAIARAYVETGEPMDKAGAYGIQENGGLLVSTINGSYSNVVGLPLNEVMTILIDYRVVRPGK